jgi:HAD superfamily hydrolase (TIGR01509 family)
LPAPSAVLFDNDGLLLDTESVWTRAESDLFERHGFEFTPDHKLELIGTSPKVAGGIIERRLEQPGRGAELMIELDELVFAELEGGVEPMPGARELVAALRDAGVPTALVSNSPRRFIERALEIVGMTGQFGALVSGHEVPEPKPAPDPYLEACSKLGVPPSLDVVVLEDSPTGVQAGLAAGLTVIGVPSVRGVVLDPAHRTASSLSDPELLAVLAPV